MKEGWKIVKLGEVCDKVSAIKWIDNETYQYIDLTSVNREQLCIEQTSTITKENAPSRAKQIIKTNDVLFGTTRPMLKRVCVVNENYDGQICSTGFCVLRPQINKVSPSFVEFILHSSEFYSYIEPLQNGATYPAVSDNIVKNYSFPLPPLSEQKKIVEELDLLNSIISKKKEQLKELDNLAQSTFYDMFGDPVENEKGWEVKKLGEVCSKITDGTHKTPTYLDSGVVFLSAKNIKNGQFVYEDVKYISKEEFLQLDNRCNPRKGDICITKSGSLGDCAIIDTNMHIALFESLCLLKFTECVNCYFIREFVNNVSVQENLIKKCIKGVGVKHLHLNELKNLVLILPPLTLQQTFAEKIEAIEKMKNDIRCSIAETQTLWDATMDKYFG